MINAVNAYKNIRLSKKKLYNEAIKIEQKILNENVGSQDQANAAFRGFNFIEFKKVILRLILYLTRKILINLKILFY